jgi:hypothetical protein
MIDPYINTKKKYEKNQLQIFEIKEKRKKGKV